jgi:predicted nucleic acid-binding protein
MEYVADTVALVRFLSESGHIGKAALRILEGAEQGHHTIWIPAATLVEVMYLSEKNRIQLNLEEVRSKTEEVENYRIVDLGLDIVETAGTITALETFDRLIVATAKHLGFPLLTPDEDIERKGGIKTIWD